MQAEACTIRKLYSHYRAKQRGVRLLTTVVFWFIFIMVLTPFS